MPVYLFTNSGPTRKYSQYSAVSQCSQSVSR